MDTQKLSLKTLAEGNAVELFDEALQRAVENVLDPNTPPKAKRKVVLTVTIAPNEDRQMAACGVDVKAQLPPPRGVASALWLGIHHGVPMAVEGRSPTQQELFPEGEGNVRPIRKK